MRNVLVSFVFLAFAGLVACSSDAPAADDSGDGSGDDGAVVNGKKKTKVTCGTATTKACEGVECKGDGDCASSKCEASKCTQPLPPSAADNTVNAGETDVDCGGPNAQKCENGKKCSIGDDCASASCGGGTCLAPSPTDGVKNADESDVDCGGIVTKAPKCAVGKGCVANTDCESDGCDDTKHCALSRSCTQTNGGLTCGEGEVGEKDAKHESCCEALPIPGSNVKLDKYKVTAGRMRAFVERTKGDVKGWYSKNRDTLSPTAQAQLDPYVDRLPEDIDGEGGDGSDGGKAAGAMWQLGGTVFYEDRPSVSQGCYTGDAANPAFGAHTFWTGANEGEDRAFDQKFLDRLPLNCVTYPMLAAFCAWDGGRLQTYEENSAAYGAATYPWGEAPDAGGFGAFGGSDFTEIGPARLGATINACPNCDRTIMNWASNYQFPEGGVDAKPWDFAYFISAPGRFPRDRGAGGHLDIGGLMMEITASAGTAADPKYGAQVRWSRAGSWEGHQANSTGWQFPVMTKYGKTGGRCARD